MSSTTPDGTDRVDDVAAWKLVGSCDPRLPCRTAAQGAALLQQSPASRTMYGSVDATATQEAVVGGIDDRIDLKTRDVAHFH